MLKKTKPSLSAMAGTAKEIVLSFEDGNKFASFVLILMQIDKRVARLRSKKRASSDNSNKSAKSKKDSKPKLKYRNIGPPTRGPFYLKKSYQAIFNSSCFLCSSILLLSLGDGCSGSFK